MPDVSEEERKYFLYKDRCPWLRLANQRRRCILGMQCSRSHRSEAEVKVCAILILLLQDRKILLDTTLKEHEVRCQAHVNAVRAQQAAGAEPAPAAHAGSSLSRGDSSSSCKEGRGR